MVGTTPKDMVPSAAVKFFGAGTAACIADLVTFPLDTAKVRLQVRCSVFKRPGHILTFCSKCLCPNLQLTTFECHPIQIQGEAAKTKGVSTLKYRGVFGTIKTMVRTEGPRSLYNGLVAGLQRQMSFASVRIGLYDSMKQFYTRGTESTFHNLGVTVTWTTSSCCINLADINMFTGAGIVTRLLAGCTTGAMAVAFAQPTDVVKVRFQAQVRLADGGRRYNGTLDAYKTIARDEGVRGLWKGTGHFYVQI